MANYAGIEINTVSLKSLLTSKAMLVAYAFLLFALFGVIDVFYERYYLLSATAFDAGLAPGSREVAEAMKAAVFGAGVKLKEKHHGHSIL